MNIDKIMTLREEVGAANFAAQMMSMKSHKVYRLLHLYSRIQKHKRPLESEGARATKRMTENRAKMVHQQ